MSDISRFYSRFQDFCEISKKFRDFKRVQRSHILMLHLVFVSSSVVALSFSLIFHEVVWSINFFCEYNYWQMFSWDLLDFVQCQYILLEEALILEETWIFSFFSKRTNNFSTSSMRSIIYFMDENTFSTSLLSLNFIIESCVTSPLKIRISLM